MKYTQEQLEAMSDLDLSEVITIIQSINYDKRDGKIYQAIKHNGDNVISLEGSVDYCNNPSDMMPLAFDSEISLIDSSSLGCLEWQAGKFCTDFTPDIQCQHENPLRALAIVYILIKQ